MIHQHIHCHIFHKQSRTWPLAGRRGPSHLLYIPNNPFSDTACRSFKGLDLCNIPFKLSLAFSTTLTLNPWLRIYRWYSFYNCDPGVAGTKITDLLPSFSYQVTFFLIFSCSCSFRFQPLGRYIGLSQHLGRYKGLRNGERPMYRSKSWKSGSKRRSGKSGSKRRSRKRLLSMRRMVVNRWSFYRPHQGHNYRKSTNDRFEVRDSVWGWSTKLVKVWTGCYKNLIL